MANELSDSEEHCVRVFTIYMGVAAILVTGREKILNVSAELDYKILSYK